VSKKNTTPGRKPNRKELRRQQLEREKRMRALRLWVPIGVLVAALAAFILYRALEPEVEGAVFVEAAIANQHDSDLQIEFGGLPPTGGPHNPAWQNCGVYAEPVQPEYAIHSMEHGAVWLTYHPDLAPDQVAALQDAVQGQSYVLLSPYPDQSNDVVLTAWDVQLQLDSAADDRIQEFINKYRRSRGPEAGATCSGGVGTPLG
jgi:hypothetical protein